MITVAIPKQMVVARKPLLKGIISTEWPISKRKSSYLIFRGLLREEKKRPNDIAHGVSHEHHRRRNALLRKASNVGRNQGKANRKSSSK